MILQAPVSFLTALVALAGATPTPPGSLQIIESEPQGGNAPQSLVSDSAVAAQINAGSQLFTPPNGFSTSWLYIPDTWLEPLLGLNWPQGVPLQLDQNCCCNFEGDWGATFSALGWSAGTPASGPWPVLDI